MVGRLFGGSPCWAQTGAPAAPFASQDRQARGFGQSGDKAAPCCGADAAGWPPSRAQRGRAGASQQRPKAQHLPEIRYSLTRTSYPLVDAKQAVTGIDNAAKMLHRSAS